MMPTRPELMASRATSTQIGCGSPVVAMDRASLSTEGGCADWGRWVIGSDDRTSGLAEWRAR